MKAPRSILETVLYAANLLETEAFYRTVLGFEPVDEPGQISAAFRVAPDQVLLIFDPAKSSPPGRVVPSHGQTGPGHIAFRIEPEEEAPWIGHLEAAGVEIEQVHTWEDGSRSVYFRDPAGNSVELINHDIWVR